MKLKKRQIYQLVSERLAEPRRFIQVLLGPRQVGKTTLVSQILENSVLKIHYVSADEATLQDDLWLRQVWEYARGLLAQHEQVVLIVDEIQKVLHWSEMVKKMWDEDSKANLNLKVMLLGSSPWLVQKGLTESLAGRFEIIPITHWYYREMQESFGWNLDQYIFYGGYPGSAALIDSEDRWMSYINHSLIETAVSRDILLSTQINKPALLRRLFHLGCDYSGQILSYQKMIGQLHEAGNTTTLAHYLQLFDGVSLLAGIQKYAGQAVRSRASSPKFQVYNNALMTAQVGKSFARARADLDYWGRLVESAVGAYLLNAARDTKIEVYYWREGIHEVDFVLSKNDRAVAIEVKSGRSRGALTGMKMFEQAFGACKMLLVGGGGIPIEEFLQIPLEDYFDN